MRRWGEGKQNNLFDAPLFQNTEEELKPVIVLFNTLSPAGRTEDRPAVMGMKLDSGYNGVIRRVFKVLSRDPLKITIGQRPNTPTGIQPTQAL